MVGRETGTDAGRDAGTVTVTGSATALASPDYVELTLSVESIEDSPQLAVESVGRLSAALTAVLDDLRVRKASRVTTGVAVREETGWEDDEQVVYGYKASTSVRVRLPNARRIGELMQRATAEAEATIHGPHWGIADDNPAHDEARRGAATDARRRAAAYTEALGVGLGVVKDVEENSSVRRRASRREFLALRMAPSDSAEIEVEEGELSVSAAVQVIFALDQ